MTPGMLESIKRPLSAGGVSALCVVAVTLLWLKFPTAVPIAVFMAVGLAGAIGFLVCETIVLLRVAKMFAPAGRATVPVRNLPLRSLVVLGVTLLSCNALLLYLTDLRPRLVWAAAVSLAVVVSWTSARWAARRRQGRTSGG
jgi:hypothetical protein